eukprot:351058_1
MEQIIFSPHHGVLIMATKMNTYLFRPTNTGYQFRSILRAMTMLNDLYCLRNEYSVETEEIACKLVLHQTQKRPWKDLHIYAQRLLHHYYLSVIDLNISWDEISSKYSAIHDLFRSEKYDGISIKLFSTLCPNLESLSVYRMKLDPLFLDDLLDHLKMNKSSKIQQVGLYTGTRDKFEIMAKMYKNKFEQIGFKIVQCSAVIKFSVESINY